MVCELNVLDTTGHSRTIWDPNVPAEVEAAKATFDGLRAKGYIAYQVKKDSEAGEIMRTFDPEAGKMILSPPLRGG